MFSRVVKCRVGSSLKGLCRFGLLGVFWLVWLLCRVWNSVLLR